MAAVTDAKTVIETLIGRTLTNDQLLAIGTNYKKIDPYSLGQYADPDNPTAEELAQLFLDTTLRHGRDIVSQGAEKQERDDINEDNAASAIQTRIDTAVNDALANIT